MHKRLRSRRRASNHHFDPWMLHED